MRFVRLFLQADLVFLFLLGIPWGRVEGRGEESTACYRVSRDPSVGYTVSLQNVYQFPAALVSQPTGQDGYTVPLQQVRQFPASLVHQPGHELPFRGVFRSTYDQYPGPAFVPR